VEIRGGGCTGADPGGGGASGGGATTGGAFAAWGGGVWHAARTLAVKIIKTACFVADLLRDFLGRVMSGDYRPELPAGTSA